MRTFLRSKVTLLFLTLGLLAFPAVALAVDFVQADLDTVDATIQQSQNLGSVKSGVTATRTVDLYLVCNSNNHLDPNQTNNVTFAAVGSSGGSTIVRTGGGATTGASLTATSSSVTAPSNWIADGNNCNNPPAGQTTTSVKGGSSTVTIVSPNSEGTYTYTLVYNNSAGDVQNKTQATFTLTVDNTPPAAPVINSPVHNSFNNTGNVTVSGTAEANSTVEIFDNGNSIGTVTATGGNWSKALTGVVDDSHSYTAKATDAAGNTSTVSNTRTVVVDTVKPNATITTPAEGANIPQNQTVNADYSCSDSGSGIKTTGGCVGTVANGNPINTSTLGPKTFSVTATDNAGNTTTVTHNYTVVPSNHAPTVSTDAGNVSGNEGSELTNSGAFSDQDGDTLTITKDSGAGTVTPGAANGTWSWSYTPNDNGNGTVVVKADDGEGGTVTDSFNWSAANVDPTGTLGNDGPKDEGSTVTVSFSNPSDASSVDAASLHYAFDCSGGSLAGAAYASAGTSPSTSCTFNDNDSYTVTGVILDKDGGRHADSTQVTINNVDPTATFNYPSAAVDEGNNFNLSLSDPNDASSVDQAAGFTYAFDCGNGYGTFGNSDTASCPAADGPDTLSVKAKIKDKDGGATEYTGTVTVKNLPPTLGAVTNSGPINEGQSATISAPNASDPAGANDPLSYSFDCDDNGTYETSSASCAFDDNGSYTVGVKVSDGDGGADTGSTIVTANNVAPTATKVFDASADEGSSFTLKLASPLDPSNADTAAGFQYRFDCGDGSGYGAWGAANSTSCATTDNGTRNVKAEIRDKDLTPTTEYTGAVAVKNVDPVLSALSLSGNTGTACLSGNAANLSFSFSDVGTDDAHSGTINWGDGNTTNFTSSPQNNVQHTYGAGTYTITVTVNDDDGGKDSDTATVSKLYNMSGILSPFNSDPLNYSVWKYGSTIPVKVQITDCNGVSVPGLAPKVGTSLANASTPAVSINEDVFSTSNADTGNVLRYSDGQYIYNFNSKSNAITDQNATYWMSVKGFDANGKVVTNPAQVDRKFGIKSK